MSDTSISIDRSLRISPTDLLAKLEAGEPVTVVDVRNPMPWEKSPIRIRDSLRIDPLELPLDAAWSKEQLLVFY